MAKAKLRTVVFTEDFANKKKGEEFRCDGLLASQLVRVDKVATYTDVETSEVPEAPKEEAKEKVADFSFTSKEKVEFDGKGFPKKKKK